MSNKESFLHYVSQCKDEVMTFQADLRNLQKTFNENKTINCYPKYTIFRNLNRNTKIKKLHYVT